MNRITAWIRVFSVACAATLTACSGETIAASDAPPSGAELAAVIPHESPAAGAGETRVAGSCRAPASAFCTEWVGSSFSEEDVVTACPDIAQRSPTACARQEAIGSCTVFAGPDSTLVTLYYESLPEKARPSLPAVCRAAGGAWQDAATGRQRPVRWR